MKKIMMFIFLSFSFVPVLFAADVPVESVIAKVVVYQDRALITRTAEVSLEKGDSTIVFQGLPQSLSEESLRASGKGTSPVSMNGAEIRSVFQAAEANERVAAVQAELEKLRDEERLIGTKNDTLNQQRSFLDSIRNFSSVEVPKEIQTKSSAASEWMGISQYLVQSYNENNLSRVENEKALRDKQKEIQAKESELAQIGAGSENGKKTAVVNVTAKDKCSFKVELSYIVPQSSWTLSYDAKVYPDQKNCMLISYGNVRQWTGEDWKDASVTLSSAKPAVGGRMPELQPWFLDFQQLEAAQRYGSRKSARMAGSALMKEESMNDAAGAPAELQYVEAEAVQAQVSQDQGVVTFTITKPMTVLSDNRLYKSAVKTEEFQLELDYQATPKLSPYAFLHSKVTNGKEYPLAGGQMNVFVNDNYLGKSFLQTTGRGEKFDLYLGIDEEIKIKRTEMTDRRKKTLLGLKTRNDFGYKIEIENYKKEPIKIGITDQLPISKNAEIKAELIASSLKPTETKNLGIFYWELNLAPAEKQSIDFQFFVEYPADKTVPGV